MQRFTSIYALRLYELGCLYYKRDEPFLWMTVDELRSGFIVPEGAYQDWTDLRRFVLNAAIKEVNELVDEFSVEMPDDKIRRTGRKVVKFMLLFTAKQEKIAPAAEDQPVQTDLDISARALRKIEKDTIAVRQKWWALAKERGAGEIPAPTAPGNIHRWIAFVARDICADRS